MRVTRTYLEMGTPADLRPAAGPPLACRLERADRCPVALYRALYADVGGAWHWYDRLAWSDEEVRTHLDRADITVFVLWVDATAAGYFELRAHDGGSVEIAYFGLTRAFHGRGLGGWLLTEATRSAWALGATRVWLHTCTLDHPAALPNYVARGFRVVRTEDYEVDTTAVPQS